MGTTDRRRGQLFSTIYFFMTGITHAKETGNISLHSSQNGDEECRDILPGYGDGEEYDTSSYVAPDPIPPKYKEGYTIIYADKFCGLVEVGARMKDWFLYNLHPAWSRR